MKLCTLLLAVIALAACQNDTKNLNDKIDKLDKKLDALLAQRGGGGGAGAAQPPLHAPSPIARRPTRFRSKLTRSSAPPMPRSL